MNKIDSRPEIRPRLLGAKEAAIYLGRTERGIRGMVARGAVPVVRIDGRVQFDVKDLDRVIEEGKSA